MSPLCHLLEYAIDDIESHLQDLIRSNERDEFEEALYQINDLIATHIELIANVNIYLNKKFDAIEARSELIEHLRTCLAKQDLTDEDLEKHQQLRMRMHEKRCEAVALSMIDNLQIILRRQVAKAIILYTNIQYQKPKRKLSRSC